ncbi:hypothetical protein IMY05_C2125000700 [Salix suchowensis]|nr:hypothetical protein IMY05_C2125000700 [Salix suchowensis]
MTSHCIVALAVKPRKAQPAMNCYGKSLLLEAILGSSYTLHTSIRISNNGWEGSYLVKALKKSWMVILWAQCYLTAYLGYLGIEPNEIKPMPAAGVIEPILVGAAIRVEIPNSGQIFNETLDAYAQNVECPHSLLAQDKKLHSTIWKILTYLSPDTDDISCRCNVKLPLVDAIIKKGRKATCSI